MSLEQMEKTDFWYQTPPGCFLLEQEVRIVGDLLCRIPGETLVQIGGPSDLSLVKDSLIKHKYFMTLNGQITPKVASAYVDPHQLPLLPGSVDVCVVPHVLSYLEEPQALIEQVGQSLKEGGTLFVIGFNPWSLWNLSRLRFKRKFPWSGNFRSCFTVKRWLKKAKMQVIFDNTFCYRPQVMTKSRWNRFRWCDFIGRLFFPRNGAVYIIMAQKQQEGMTPLLVDLLSDKKLMINRGAMKPMTRLHSKYEE